MKIMSAALCKKRPFLRRLQIVFPILLGLALLFAAPGWCRSYGSRSDQEGRQESTHVRGNGRTAPKNRSHISSDRNSSSYDNNRLRNKAREWEKLPPQKQDDLRHRMDRFEKLPPEDRSLYKKRYRQMRELPPDQQDEIRNKLRKMDRLSPEEKEEIRKKFK